MAAFQVQQGMNYGGPLPTRLDGLVNTNTAPGGSRGGAAALATYGKPTPKPTAAPLPTAAPRAPMPSYSAPADEISAPTSPRSYGSPSMPSLSAPNIMEPWQGSAPQSAPPDTSNEQTASALTGLQGAFKQVHGPAPGWADDAPLGDTANRLAVRTPSTPVTTLMEVVRRFGKAY